MTTLDTPGVAGSAESSGHGHYCDYVQADTVPAPPYMLERSPLLPRDDYTVDAARYTSTTYQGLETDRLWSKVWQLACRENDIPNVGDYIEYQIMGISILLVRSNPFGDQGISEQLPPSRGDGRHRIRQPELLHLSLPRLGLRARRRIATSPSQMGSSVIFRTLTPGCTPCGSTRSMALFS